jgi:hypothetical protein
MSTKRRRKQQKTRENFDINSSDAVGVSIAERKRGGKGDKRGNEGLEDASGSLASAVA